MHLILHLGAHGTDDGRIARWLRLNGPVLARAGTLAPPPAEMLAAMSAALSETDIDPQAREEALLRRFGAAAARRRLTMSAPGLLGSVGDVLSAEGFYRRDVARRLLGLRTLFPRCRLTLLLAVRRPSGLLTTLLRDDDGDFTQRLAGLGNDGLPWSRLVRLIRQQVPDAQVIVWRHEDFAQVWPDVLRSIAGGDAPLPPAGILDLAAGHLSHEARFRVDRYLRNNPAVSAGHLRRVVAAFARRYGLAPALDPAAESSGWADRHLAQLDQSYDTEWADIEGLRGVIALRPELAQK